jgi:hypothetical protein
MMLHQKYNFIRKYNFSQNFRNLVRAILFLQLVKSNAHDSGKANTHRYVQKHVHVRVNLVQNNERVELYRNHKINCCTIIKYLKKAKGKDISTFFYSV